MRVIDPNNAARLLKPKEAEIITEMISVGLSRALLTYSQPHYNKKHQVRTICNIETLRGKYFRLELLFNFMVIEHPIITIDKLKQVNADEFANYQIEVSQKNYEAFNKN